MGNNNSVKKDLSEGKSLNTPVSKKTENIQGSGKDLVGSITKDLVGLNTYYLMDDKNKAAADVMASKGVDAAIEHMMTSPDGKQRTYAEMRELYG